MRRAFSWGEQQSRRFPSTNARLWTESWWIFRTRARAPAQPANCYRAALTNLCRCINRSQAALTRPPCLLSSEKRPNKQLRERRALSSLCRLKGRLQKEPVVCISASRICLILFAIFYLCIYLFSTRLAHQKTSSSRHLQILSLFPWL